MGEEKDDGRALGSMSIYADMPLTQSKLVVVPGCGCPLAAPYASARRDVWLADILYECQGMKPG